MLPELARRRAAALERRVLVCRRDRDRATNCASCSAPADFVDAAMPGGVSPGVAPMKVMTVVGTRPELIRPEPRIRELEAAGVEHHLVHTGQNFDPRLVGHLLRGARRCPRRTSTSGSRRDASASRSARSSRARDVDARDRPDALLILGDTNSGLSAIAAARHDVPIFHMEAGNRCFDWRVPEEKNRKLIDHVQRLAAALHAAVARIPAARGLPPQRVLVPATRSRTSSSTSGPGGRRRTSWTGSGWSRTATCCDRAPPGDGGHSASAARHLRGPGLVAADELAVPVVWSVHPRTRGRLERRDLELDERIQLHEPVRLLRLRAARGERAAAWSATAGRCRRSAACSRCRPSRVARPPSGPRRSSAARTSSPASGSRSGSRVRAMMIAAGRDWVSPYEADHGVAETWSSSSSATRVERPAATGRGGTASSSFATGSRRSARALHSSWAGCSASST